MDLAEALATIALLQGQIVALEQQVADRDAALLAARQELTLRAFEITRLKRALFGPRTERVAPDALVLPGVMLAANDPAVAAPPAAQTATAVKAHARTRRGAGRRACLDLAPESVTERHEHVDPVETHCACCGDALRRVGEETRTVVAREPARYTRTTVHRHKKACARCKGAGVVIAPAEDPPATGPGPVGASLAVDIAVMHHADHLPYHRLVGIFAREGLRIDRSTLARVGARVACALRPVVDTMEAELLAGDGVVGIDGTGIKLFASPHCQRRTVYVLHGQGHVVYRALERGSADDVLAGFEGFGGVVLSDAAKVHVGTKSTALGLVVALCGAHARRYFFDARTTDAARAAHALAVYQQIARAERRFKDLDPVARQRERQRELRPLLDAFHNWLLAELPHLMPRSPMRDAFQYALHHWDGLCRFLDDGRIPWTNNESERLLRHIVVGRRAWTFRGSFKGAENACVLWSLMQSCRALGLDPRRYLIDTLEALRTTPHRGLANLTPRAYAARLRQAARAA